MQVCRLLTHLRVHHRNLISLLWLFLVRLFVLWMHQVLDRFHVSSFMLHLLNLGSSNYHQCCASMAFVLV